MKIRHRWTKNFNPNQNTMKTKFKPCVIHTKNEMETVVADVVRLKLELAEQTAIMEQEIAEIQKAHQAELLELNRQIETKEAGAQIWCEQNRDLFGEKKSMDLLLAVVGFRTTPFRVEKVNSKDTFGKIAKRVAVLDWGDIYIREPDPELSKDQLLADRTKLTAEQLKQIGIRFEQDEHFYIEPKSKLLESTVKQAA